jgi:hypothetical protein
MMTNTVVTITAAVTAIATTIATAVTMMTGGVAMVGVV